MVCAEAERAMLGVRGLPHYVVALLRRRMQSVRQSLADQSVIRHQPATVRVLAAPKAAASRAVERIMTMLEEIEEAFATSPVPCKIVDGKKHKKIFVGPKLAGIMPLSGKDTNDKTRRARMNTLSQIR